MKNSTNLVRKYLMLLSVLLFSSYSFSQDFNVQHLTASNIGRSGGNNTITAVSSLNSAFVLNNNNRLAQAGRPDNNGTHSATDLSGAAKLTATNTVTFYRDGGSTNNNTRFSTSIWDYTGTPGGANEFIVRGRYVVTLNGTNNSTTQALSGISNANKCIPFITGIVNNATVEGADSGSAIAYLENASTMRIQKGSNINNVSVYITIVEFTGSNWTILHGDSGAVDADTGNITLRANANGTGTATNVSNWNNAMIFTHHRGNIADNNVDEAIADNWPITRPGANNQTVSWEFHSNHDAAASGNRHFIHVANNPNINISRFSDSSSTEGLTNVDITSAALSNINEALIIGTATSSGTGTAYGRGWRNFYLNSTTQAAHWAHRSGNTIDNEIQVINLATPRPEINIVGLGNTINDGDLAPTVIDNTDFGSVLNGTTSDHTFTIQNTGAATLNLTGGTPLVDISGNAAFTILTQPSGNTIASGSSRTFVVRFSPTVLGTVTADISIDNNDSNENPYNFRIQGTGSLPTYCSASGSTSYETGITRVQFNTIDNSDGILKDVGYEDFTAISTTVDRGTTYNLSTNVNTDGGFNVYARVWFDWNQDGDFVDPGEEYNMGSANSVTNSPTSGSPSGILIPATATLGNTRMRVSARYNGYADSCDTGFDGEIEDYTINITSGTPQPEINITGLAISITDGDILPTPTDDSEFGSVGAGSTVDHTFTIQNTGTATLNLTGGSPLVDISGNAAFTILTQPSGSTIAAGSSRTFVVRFAPTIGGTVTANISIDNNDSNENPYNFRVQGSGVAALTEGPGGVTNDLALWLKGTDGLGYTNGQPVTLWADQGRGANATVNTAGQEPTYFDNPTRNVNFNPVVEFDNTFSSFSLDGDYSYDDTSTQFLEGTSGLYTQDIFVVVIPDDTVINRSFGFMDVFCGDADFSTNSPDATGIGFGDYTGRITNETISFAIDSYNQSIPGDGYAVQDGPSTTYDNVGIINTRNNTGATQQQLFYNANNIEYLQNDIPSFVNVSDSRFWIGRSEGWEATLNGRMCEIITYSARKDDVNLTRERNRIQSYLAIKYGITLGVNGTSQDYVDSDGTLIWDVNTGTPALDVFNYDIAGIGRDDASDLHQKQSRSVNKAIDGGFRAQGVLTIGMGNLSNTNSLNANSELEDKEFLVWGNNGIDLDNAAVIVDVDMSTDISPTIPGGTHVQFNGIARTWKVVEKVAPLGDIPAVEVAILKSAVRTATPPNGRYLMFISDTPNFDPTADYRVMTEGTNELGEAILKTNYDFDDTKYITFGWAPERTFERSVYFNGTTNYVDMEDALDVNPTAFTISSWIRRDANSLNKSILSKRDASYTEGYDFKINPVGQFEVSWKTFSGAIQRTTSNTIIPQNEWHQVAVIYQSGTAYLYIDGILDKQEAKTAPNNTDESFYIGAASKLTPQAFFNGNIDEVRIWNKALSVAQLRYIMNQEIENNSGFVGGAYFLSKSVTPTKDEVATIPWSSLAGYYPMSTYTYTNTKDESGNGNQGALRTLRTVDKQTAPLPYKSAANTAWDTNSTWANGSIQTIPGTNSLVDNTKTVDWNIVETNHNITMNNSSLATANADNRNLLALFVESNKITVDGDNTSETGNGVTITHHLNLEGKIDLEGESQLIQTIDSDLMVGTSGTLEKDQQGTRDLFTYNYWSAPVGNTATANPNNYSYTLNNNIMKDGTSSGSPSNITYVGGYNGSNGDSGVRIAHYWIWKFNNRLTDDYASWQHVRNTGSILAGEGFTMKGVANTSGSVTLEQNYVFDGKPNNGDVTLPINNGNEYLVGNPYASAIDAEQFITDNGSTISGAGANPLISGTLYFWEHWGGGSHVLAEYQGGYGTYNFSGGSPAVSMGINDPDVGTGGTPTKTPGRYIPVGQGFFVAGEANGNVTFNNGQRIFQKEGGSASVFMRSTETNTDVVDSRMKIRLGFNSVNNLHRQLLVTADSRASVDYDWGFDALLNEVQMDDMSWLINTDKYTIQGVDVFEESTILPLAIKTDDDGLNSITIDALENISDDLNIFVHDIALDIYHNLRTDGDYEIYLAAGEYVDRFELTFTDSTSLSTEDFVNQDILNVYFANTKGSIIIHNPKMILLDAAEMFNMLGQSVIRINKLEDTNYQEIKVNGLSTGTYIINLEKTDGSLVTKKVIVN